MSHRPPGPGPRPPRPWRGRARGWRPYGPPRWYPVPIPVEPALPSPGPCPPPGALRELVEVLARVGTRVVRVACTPEVRRHRRGHLVHAVLVEYAGAPPPQGGSTTYKGWPVILRPAGGAPTPPPPPPPELPAPPAEAEPPAGANYPGEVADESGELQGARLVRGAAERRGRFAFAWMY